MVGFAVTDCLWFSAFKLPLVQCYSRVASSPGHSQAHGLAIGSSYLQRTLAEGISWDGPRDA